MVPVLLAPPPCANALPANATVTRRASKPFVQNFMRSSSIGGNPLLVCTRANSSRLLKSNHPNQRRTKERAATSAGRRPEPDVGEAGTRQNAACNDYNDLQI